MNDDTIYSIAFILGLALSLSLLIGFYRLCSDVYNIRKLLEDINDKIKKGEGETEQ